MGAWEIILALLIFCALVVSHEWGHFMVARKNGVLVEEFSIGMGPRLFGWTRGETKYSVRAIPLGGYCKMQGEIEESSDPRDFNNKSVWSRIKILAAGPLMNFAVAIVLIMILTCAEGYIAPVAKIVKPDFPAAEAGMLTGDEIVAINGRGIGIYEEISLEMDKLPKNKEIELTVKRAGEELHFFLTPKLSEETGTYLIGFTPDYKTGLFDEPLEGYSRAGFFDSLAVSFKTMIFYIRATAEGIAGLFTQEISPNELTGPIGMVQVIGNSYEVGLQYSLKAAIMNVLYIAAILSANLGAVNLFPLPALDGGRLLLYIIEAIRGKGMNRNAEGILHFAGFIVLFGLMIFIAFNDISKMI